MSKTRIRLFFLCATCMFIIIANQQYMAEEPHVQLIQDEVAPTPHDNSLVILEQPEPRTELSQPIDNQKKHRTITVRNKVTKKMITYTKGFMQYTPDFVISINDVPINEGTQETITINNDCLTASYSYNFMNGYKKGTKVIEFTVPSSKQELDVTFSWQDDWRLIISGAEPSKVISEVS